MAQADGANAVEVCKSFCSASKKQCEKDAIAPGLAGLALGITLGQMQENQNNSQRADTLDSLQREQKYAASTNKLTLDSQQQCDKELLQCKQDCAAQSLSEQQPAQPAKPPYAQPPAKDAPLQPLNQ